MTKVKERRIAITRDPTTGRLVSARDAESDRNIPVDAATGSIKVGRRWYELASNAKEVLIPRDILAS